MLLKTVKIGRESFRVRGYEGKALKYLHEEKSVPIKALRVSADHELPTIHYTHGGRPRWYFPDIMIETKKRKILIEVKSIYTIARSLKQEKQVIAKFKAANEQHEFWLLLIHQKQFVLIKNPARYTVAQILSKVGVTRPY